MVLVDDRESAWVKGLRFGNVPTAVQRLDTDVLVLLDDGTLIGFEHKEANDLLGTMRDKRLFPQLEKLRALTPWVYLVIVGDLRPGRDGKVLTDGRETGWNWVSVQGMLLSVQEIGVHVVQCQENDFESTVTRIANRERKPVRIQPARDTVLLSEAEIFLTALPGIGPDKADTVLKRCGSAAWGLSLLTNLNIEGTPGIGDGIKRKVRAALGLADEEVLNVVNYKTGNPPEPT